MEKILKIESNQEAQALFVAGKLLSASLFDPTGEIDATQTMAWLLLLFVAVALHEIGHLAAAAHALD